MNFRQIFTILSKVASFIGLSMILSLPWAFSPFGGDWFVESRGFWGLLLSIVIALSLGAFLKKIGEKSKEIALQKKESMAAVPLSWILAIFLASLPYLLSRTETTPGHPMTIPDTLFEATSGLTTTGATVLGNVEDPLLIPRTILFWRATTHFLGGLGIMVFFVVLLGYGTAGKSVLLLEKGMSSAGSWGQIRKFALTLAGTYIGLISLLALLLFLYGVPPFHAICHAFSTLSTGGFSTYNASIGHFAAETGLNASLIESTIILFMILAGTNYVLLYFAIIGQPRKLFEDTEWRTFIGMILVATLLIFTFGMIHHDFDIFGTSDSPVRYASNGEIPWYHAFRQTLFQVVSIITGTGFVTDEYEKWCGVSQQTLLILMFIGGCVGSTSGGTKVFRSIVAFKTFGHEMEKTFRPNVVRPIKVGNVVIENGQQYRMTVFVLLFAVSVVLSSLLVMIIEPGTLWTEGKLTQENRMIDIFSSTLSMFGNVGPGLGVNGARQNFGNMSEITKILFSWEMLLGRLELYLPLILFRPGFWKK